MSKLIPYLFFLLCLAYAPHANAQKGAINQQHRVLKSWPG